MTKSSLPSGLQSKCHMKDFPTDCWHPAHLLPWSESPLAKPGWPPAVPPTHLLHHFLTCHPLLTRSNLPCSLGARGFRTQVSESLQPFSRCVCRCILASRSPSHSFLHPWFRMPPSPDSLPKSPPFCVSWWVSYLHLLKVGFLGIQALLIALLPLQPLPELFFSLLWHRPPSMG